MASAGIPIPIPNGMDGINVGPGTAASRAKRDETSRRLALLFAIVLASALMVTTCLGFLALSKSQYGWRLISLDLIDESQKSVDQRDMSSSVNNILGVDSNRKVTRNEERLILALQSDLMKSCLLYIMCWLGSVNCLVTFVLIYGIFVRSYAHMLAWAIVSILSLAAAMISFLTAIPDYAPLMNYCTVATMLTLLFVYMLMNSMIMQYIKRVSYNYKRILNTLSVKTYAGCVHTLNINKHIEQMAPELPKKEPLSA